MKQLLIASVLILVVMSGMAVAEGDRMYGMMSSDCPDCPDCVDVMDAMENLPFAQFDAMSMEVTATSDIVIEEEWAYERRNYAPDGVRHVYWDFEEGSNLGVFKNAHPTVASFENVSNTHCCYPACSDINEPSYVRSCVSSGPRCKCVMHIYPCATTYYNGTELPYIHILNGRAAFSPRVEVGAMRCYYPACSAFIAFKDNINYVSFLASTNGNLNVRVYDRRNNYLGSRTIYCNTDRIGNGSSNFTRFTIHMPSTEIGYLTFHGPFNGWHIDDLIAGGEFGHPEMRRDYGWAAERLKTLIGAKHHNLGLGYLIHSHRFLTATEIKDDKADPYWNPFNEQMEFGEGICPEAAIIWAFNEDKTLINNLYMNDQFSEDFTEDVAHEDLQPGDVFFIDYSPADGQIDEVGMYIGSVGYDPVLGYDTDIIRIVPGGGGVQLSSSEHVNSLYDVGDGFVYYRSLPDKPRGGKSPYPKVPGKYKI